MKKQAINEKKMLWKASLLILLCCLTLVSSVGSAKSLYVAGDSGQAGQDVLWVYDVQPSGKLVLQTSTIFPDDDARCVNGLGVDPNSDTLLITYENSRYAGLLNSESLDWLGFAYMVPVDIYAGGLAYDVERSRVYCTDQGRNNQSIPRLIIYNWVPELLGLHNIGYGLSDVPLSQPSAGAIAYDPDKEMVYVASRGNGIQVLKTAFDRAHWQQLGNLNLEFEAQALSVDARNQYLYAGGQIDNKSTIVQLNLATGAQVKMTVPDGDGSVLSLCVDNATSLVYALTESTANSEKLIRVLDRGFNVLQTIAAEGNACQLYVPSTSVGYNPLNLTITPVSGVAQSNGQYVAGPGAQIEYQVCMTNSNLFPVTDLILTDPLPDGLDFVRAEGLGNALGVFDQQGRTYYYHNPYLGPGSAQCFKIVARVNGNTQPGDVITNAVAVDSNETAQSGASVDVEVGYNTLGLTKSVVMDPNHLKVGNTIYVGAGDTVTYEICLSNLANIDAITNVLLVDQLSEHVEFVSAEQAGLINHYDVTTHSYSWAFNVIEPNFLDCYDITVRIKDNVPPGQLIVNEVVLGGSETFTVTAAVDVVVKYDSLVLNKGIKNSGDYNPITNQIVRGGIITYTIDVNNVDPMYPAENVVIIDTVPPGLLYIGASIQGDVNGVYDSIARTFTLELPYIGPGQGLHVELTFVVADDLAGNTVLTNQLIALANGAPASGSSVSVTVYEPNTGIVSATLDLYYTVPLNQGHGDEIMAVMKLPEYINLTDINTTQPLIMTPGPAAAYHRDSVEGIPTVYYMYTGVDGKLTVKGFFDRQLILDALGIGQETVNITVTGSLKTGQSFIGQALVPVN